MFYFTFNFFKWKIQSEDRSFREIYYKKLKVELEETLLENVKCEMKEKCTFNYEETYSVLKTIWAYCVKNSGHCDIEKYEKRALHSSLAYMPKYKLNFLFIYL